MPPSDAVLRRLAQIDQELTTVLSEYPNDIALERLRFVRALVRFVKTQIEIDDDEATIPVLTDFEPPTKTASGDR